MNATSRRVLRRLNREQRTIAQLGLAIWVSDRQLRRIIAQLSRLGLVHSVERKGREKLWKSTNRGARLVSSWVS